MTEILKFLKFQQLLKHILTVFSSLGGFSVCGLGHSGSQPFNYPNRLFIVESAVITAIDNILPYLCHNVNRGIRKSDIHAINAIQ